MAAERIELPLPCGLHRDYGGKKAPTSGCPGCEAFYIERGSAVEKIKAALRLLDGFGAVAVDDAGNMAITAPGWMRCGKKGVTDSARVEADTSKLVYRSIYRRFQGVGKKYFRR